MYRKNFSHYEFLVQLVFAPRFKQRHIPRYNYIKRQQQKKKPRGINKSNDLWMRLTCCIKKLRNPFCFRPLTDVLTRKSNAPPGGPWFGSNSPLYGAYRGSNARGLPGGGGMGGLGIDWYITCVVSALMPWGWLKHHPDAENVRNQKCEPL